jgi:hypothetical protein
MTFATGCSFAPEGEELERINQMGLHGSLTPSKLKFTRPAPVSRSD